MSPTKDPREPDGNPGLMARGELDALEGDLEDKLRSNSSHGSELVEGVVTDERIYFSHLLVG